MSNDNMKELFQELMVESDIETPKRRKAIVKPEFNEVPFRVNEALNILRGNIQLSGYNLKTIAITSSMANEGKSSVAFRLAKSFAGLEKRVVYVDCDIRNSVIKSRYHIQGDKKGLSEYLCGECTKEKVIYHTDDRYMDVLFAGAIAPNPSELLSGPRFRELLSFLKSIYDYVIVDTPPVNLVIDGMMVAKQCDGTILVVESGVTERAQVEKVKKQMEYANVKLLGAVLNKVNTKSGRYGYGYGYEYGYGYGERGSKKNAKKKASKKK